MTAQDLSGVNARELGRLVREHRKREGLSLRAAADACGCPFNTLGRVEKGHLPDLANFARLARWAGFDPDVILGRTRIAQHSTSDTIRAALHADPNLDEAAADQIAGVLDSLYGTLARTPSVVAHVHAAQVMTPAASRMTANILGDLERALTGGAA